MIEQQWCKKPLWVVKYRSNNAYADEADGLSSIWHSKQKAEREATRLKEEYPDDLYWVESMHVNK